ncbi:MAG: SPASM domain-containing protein, partial [Gemmatimonadetes bacterium]|nr:SPASM domain-containing protein [Gemmatimonadota bacterium]
RGLEPRENDEVLVELLALEQEYRGRMMVRSKCQPQIMRHAYQAAADSPLLNYETRCPCGVQYCRITPEGKLTPCPYLPAVAGDLRRQSFAEVWTGSALFRALREGELGGKCGRCEYRKVCGGCRARAFAEGGDYLGPDLSCAYEPSGEAALVEPRARVTYGMAEAPGLRWTPEARQRIARVPSFVRAVVVARVEEYAREHRYAEVTAVLLDEVRQQLPVDFSKRRPFFLRARGDS